MVGSLCDADLFITEQPVPATESGDGLTRCASCPLGSSVTGGQRRKLGEVPRALGAVLVGILQLLDCLSQVAGIVGL